jgi:hypothetical protein
MSDPRAPPTFVVRVTGDPGAGASSLATALLDFPYATDDEVARLRVLDAGEEPEAKPDVALFVVRGLPGPGARERLAELASTAKSVLVAVHARDLDPASDDSVRAAWGALLEPSRVALTSTPPGKPPRGVDDLRAIVLRILLDSLEVPIDRARRARRPFATAIIAGAAVVTAAEGFLPGAAAFVAATQVGAVASLYYLYTGRWLARSQALAILPAFAAEAVGGSLFLIVKSFLPPTGVADVAAAAVAASLTVSMLGAVAWALEHGYSLQEKAQLTLAFKRMKAKTRAERARIVAAKHRWTERAFWEDLVRRVVFD